MPFGPSNIFNQTLTPTSGSGSGYEHADVATHRAGQAALDLQELNLFDPAVIAQLQPYITQLLGNFSGQAASQANRAGQAAGAYAASQGIANPSSYATTARLRSQEASNPVLENLLSNTIPGLVSQSQQFRANNLMGAAGINQNLANLFEGRRQFNENLSFQKEGPGFLEFLGSGLFGGLGALASGPFGASLGASLFGGGGSSPNYNPNGYFNRTP